MKKACGSFLPTRKIHYEKKLTLLRIKLQKLYFHIIITKLLCSLGYNKYVAKLSDLVTPALDYSPATLGDGTHQPTLMSSTLMVQLAGKTTLQPFIAAWLPLQL